jgi:hypothetical protein
MVSELQMGVGRKASKAVPILEVQAAQENMDSSTAILSTRRQRQPFKDLTGHKSRRKMAV